MARMHGRAGGKSRSNKPLTPTKPSWVTHSKKEVEILVNKLHKEGSSPAQIGITLRDTYGIPSVRLLTDKRVESLLEEKNTKAAFPSDMFSLMKRAVKLHKHLTQNKHDQTSKRGLQLTKSKILRLAKYYKREGKVPQEWKYSQEDIALIASE